MKVSAIMSVFVWGVLTIVQDRDLEYELLCVHLPTRGRAHVAAQEARRQRDSNVSFAIISACQRV